MSRPRVEVHHFVANLLTRQYGPDPSRDLLGVKYRHRFSPDMEFPVTLAQLDLFTRFNVRGSGTIRFRVRVRWLDPVGRVSWSPTRRGPFAVRFPPNETVRDHSFRLRSVPIPGVGRYVIRLLVPGQGWEARRWVPIANTYFEVVTL